MKTLRILLLILGILIVLPFAGRLLWYLQKSRSMELMVINKTVTKANQNEFKALNWVLNYKKFLKADGRQYDYKLDYFGYHPDAPGEEWLIRSFRLENLPALKEQFDAVVFLDNEGVPADLPGNTLKAAYGGLNQNDYLLLKEMIQSGKLIIAEYNFFSEPTVDLVRFNTEQLLDIYSIGWKGKYFDNLDARKIKDIIDIRWLDRYKEYYGKNWDFTGPGLILMNPRQNRILVLPAAQYMEETYPSILTKEENSGLLKLPIEVAYDGWFEVVYQGNNTVMAEFDLNLNMEGIELLKTAGLESKFPALISHKDHRFYYMAGNFSGEPVSLLFSRIRMFSGLITNLNKNRTNNPGLFFHTYYVPLMSGLLTGYPGETK